MEARSGHIPTGKNKIALFFENCLLSWNITENMCRSVVSLIMEEQRLAAKRTFHWAWVILGICFVNLFQCNYCRLPGIHSAGQRFVGPVVSCHWVHSPFLRAHLADLRRLCRGLFPTWNYGYGDRRLDAFLRIGRDFNPLDYGDAEGRHRCLLSCIFY